MYRNIYVYEQRTRLNNIAIPQIISDLNISFSSADEEMISQQRKSVTEYIMKEDSLPVYGFTTLLGHFDNRPIDIHSQNSLLDAHLVGEQESFPPEWGELLLLCKIRSLQAGGSGIHPETYSCLVKAYKNKDMNNHMWDGAWTSTYGSGDVVPASWFVKNLQDYHGLELKHPGDLIALINGNFISTAFSIIGALQFNQTAYESLHLIEQVHAHHTDKGSRTVQLPVTMRDLSPIFHQVQYTLDNLSERIIERLNRPSGNPLFLDKGDGLRPYSQSSFLDFTLSSALLNAQHVCIQLGAYLKGSIHLRETTHTDDPATTPIQPTKIAQAHIYKIIQAVSSSSLGYSISESNGIEDVCDLTVLNASGIIKSTQALQELIGLCKSEMKAGSILFKDNPSSQKTLSFFDSLYNHLTNIDH